MHISELDTPAMLIDRQILLHNIRRAQGYFTKHGIAFRPHIKTHKMPPIAQLQIEAGAVGLTCAKLGETEVIADAGINCDVVSGASTPNLFLSHLLKPVNENRCGTYVFNDRNTVHYGEMGWDDCAARVAATVVSTAVPGQVIIDGGSKTFSGDG